MTLERNDLERRDRRLDEYRGEIETWLEAEPGLQALQVAARLAPRAGELSERTVQRYLAELRRASLAPDRAAAASGDAGSPSEPDVALRAHDLRPAPPNGRTPELPPHYPRTPADSKPVPTAGPDGEHDLAAAEYYLNRELTWLNFNFRVLHEAADPRTPLLERVKFVAIVGSNLDEFFMKRIGGLKQQAGAGIQDLTVDGRTPEQQIEECYELVRELEREQRRIILELVEELKAHDIQLCTFAELSEEERRDLREDYLENIYPLVTPQATDPAHPFPFVSNLALNLLVTLRYPKDQTPSLARVKIPVGGGIPRFIRIGDTLKFVRMETVIAHNLDLLFPGMEIDSFAMFRVTRNANTERDEEQADDLLSLIESELRDRRFAPIVRLEVAKSMTAHHRGMLAAELGLNEQADVFEVEGMLGVRDLMEIAGIANPSLHDPPHHPVDHPELTSQRNLFHVIRDVGPILLHHPYVSFATSVERFLKEAAHDPKVRAIKMSLYRTSADTQAIRYLIEAARNGKQVAVVVELKARFDEEANIRWANRMEEAGVHVTYGVVGLKTHCKVVMVVRKDYDRLRTYAHVGTGNYHAGTARLYSDLGMLTCDPAIGKDLTELFNYLTTGYKPKRNFTKLLPAPKICKLGLLERIAREVELHAADGQGLIRFKLNALEDAEITRALYEATRAGVRVELFVRDTCRFRPGIPGLSESARVISTVGRFLEHCRIYYFRNGGEGEEYYIGSADAMQRNLNSRVEVLAPVEAPALRQELFEFLEIQQRDRRSAWELQPDGSYIQLQPPAGEEPPTSQELLIQWHEDRLREATRLRRRRLQGIDRRRGR